MFLRFRIDGTELLIDRHPDPELVRRRYKIRALREVVSYALSRSVRPSGEQTDRTE
jgi:hypothetical protein